jgi:hypothetical protein
VSGGITPFKFYSPKALEFLKQDLSFNKRNFFDFVDYQNPKDFDIYTEEGTCLATELLKLITKPQFPTDFKHAFDEIFKFLDNFFRTNPQLDSKPISDMFFSNNLYGITPKYNCYLTFQSSSKTLTDLLEKQIDDFDLDIARKQIVVKLFLNQMKLLPNFYQIEEFNFVNKVFLSDEDNAHKLNTLYKFFELIRPKLFKDFYESSLKDSKLLGISFFLPKNNFYFVRQLCSREFAENVEKSFKGSDTIQGLYNSFILFSYGEKGFEQAINYDIKNQPFKINDLPISSPDRYNPNQIWYFCKYPNKSPNLFFNFSKEEQLDYISATCLGIIYKGKFYENPSAIEIKTPK